MFATNLTRSLYRRFLSQYQPMKNRIPSEITVNLPDNAWVYVDQGQIRCLSAADEANLKLDAGNPKEKSDQDEEMIPVFD